MNGAIHHDAGISSTQVLSLVSIKKGQVLYLCNDTHARSKVQQAKHTVHSLNEVSECFQAQVVYMRIESAADMVRPSQFAA